MSKTDEANFEVEKIRKDMRNLQALVDQAMRQYDLANQYNLPDSTPYFSFKTPEKIEDLKGSGLGLRAALQRDILQGKMRLKQLEQEARRIKRGDYAAVVERQHDALLAADKDADRRALAIINRAANSSLGGMTEEEFAEVQKLMLQSLKGHADFLRRHPSRQNIKETMDKFGRAQSMGMDGNDISDDAMRAVHAGAKHLVNLAKSNFFKKPGPKTATALIEEIANNEILGGDSAMGIINAEVIPKLKEQMLAAERLFRNTPTKENCEAMFNAEYACASLGGPQLPSPPTRLKRIKQGTSRHFGPRDMLSAVSKEYYGSFGYWDVIYKANWGAFNDPDKPSSNMTITIPF